MNFARLLCALVLVSLPTFSHAQQSAAPYPTNIDWSGFFVGGHVGYGAVGQDSIFDSSASSGPLELDDSTLGRDMDLEGVLGGLNIGWNTMTGSVVWGVEADVTYLGASDRASDPESEGTNGSTTDNASLDVKWLASLRGRIGIASARSLLFATAGVAWVDAKYAAQNLDNSASDQGSVSLSGPGIVVGGGVEHAVSDRLSIKLEGLYYKFDNRKDTNSLTTDSG
ncbi:MAG: outer membrane beta-barrel protein, partial [Pseudomonadota bacterium]